MAADSNKSTWVQRAGAPLRAGVAAVAGLVGGEEPAKADPPPSATRPAEIIPAPKAAERVPAPENAATSKLISNGITTLENVRRETCMRKNKKGKPYIPYEQEEKEGKLPAIIDSYIARLGNDSFKTRNQASAKLELIGNRAALALHKAFAIEKSITPQGSEKLSRVTSLIDQLKPASSEQLDEFRTLMEKMSAHGKEAAAAVGILAKIAVEEPNPALAGAALSALQRIGVADPAAVRPVLPKVFPAFEWSPHSEVKRGVVSLFATHGLCADDRAVGVLVHQFRTMENDHLRWLVLMDLRISRTTSKEALKIYMETLGHKDTQWFRPEAVKALGDPELIKSMTKEEKMSAVIGLMNHGLASPDGNEELRKFTTQTLGAYGPDAAPATHAIIEFSLSSRYEENRLRAIRVLGSIGPAAGKKAVEELQRDLPRERNRVVRDAIHDAVGRITDRKQSLQP